MPRSLREATQKQKTLFYVTTGDVACMPTNKIVKP